MGFAFGERSDTLASLEHKGPETYNLKPETQH
jgi:hypothetical protein